ncbi:MAG: fluoride efflux transporter CrcB [Anaerolineae bacterium]
MQLQNLLWVGVGGFFGANARYLVSYISDQHLPHSFSFGTLLVNLSGSFLLALFLSYVVRRADVPQTVTLLVGTGFFGAYTTFSTYANESISLFNQGQWGTGIAYLVVTNVLCLIGVVAGLMLAHRIF